MIEHHLQYWYLAWILLESVTFIFAKYSRSRSSRHSGYLMWVVFYRPNSEYLLTSLTFAILVRLHVLDFRDSPNLVWPWCIFNIHIYSSLNGYRHDSHHSQFGLLWIKDHSRSSKQIVSKWIFKCWWFVDGAGRYLWGTVRQSNYEGSLQ